MLSPYLISKVNPACLLFSLILLASSVENVFSAANSSDYDTTRIYNAMLRAQNGEDITLGFLGGSITAGYAASSEENRWVNLVTAWWQTQFPQSNITLINAGLGGTGSDIGTHRVQNDILQYDPDVIFIEFSVNDAEGELAQKMMEGLVRQLLQADSLPGIMILMLKQDNGTTAQNSHKPVGNHYGVPMISFADLIDDEVAKDGITISECYVDGLHPNDVGMAYIAEFIIDELDIIINQLPAPEDMQEIDTSLPDPLITDVYAHTFMYFPDYIVPASNAGWSINSNDWTAENPGDEISFIVDGNAISIIYSKHNADAFGQVDVWVDDGAPLSIDAYWEQTWGPAQVFALIAEGLDDGEHTLHLKIRETTSTNGHYFKLMNVLKAGNWTGVAPIAKAGDQVKTLINSIVELDGSQSFDPDEDSLVSYEWSVVSAPEGSVTTVANPFEIQAEFTPDFAGFYKIGLVVNDGISNSVPDIKTVHAVASNTAPTAVAGNDTTMSTKKFFFPDGSRSYDADGDAITKHWTLVSAPAGSNAVMSDPDSRNARVYLDVEGEYVVGLTVNDSIEDSQEDYLTITAIEGYNALIDKAVKNTVFIYPNPATNHLTLNLTTKETGQLKISLFSVDGEWITDLINTGLFTGKHVYTFNLDAIQLEAGMYMLYIDTEKKITALKFLKI